MARPTKPKDLKPKVDGEGGAAAAPEAAAGGGGGGGLDLKFIIMVVVILVATIGGSVGSSYLMTTMFVVPELSKLAHAPAGEHGAGEGDGHAPTGHDGASTETPGSEVGMNLELDEFMVNLKPDPNLAGSQYLRAKMALSVKVPEAQNCYVVHHASAMPVGDGKIVGAAAPVDRTMLANGGEAGPSCEDVFKKNMSKYVPTVRDVINAALMKRGASSLATLEGQESLKDEIKEQLTSIMAPDYQVLRVNFQDFIIQR